MRTRHVALLVLALVLALPGAANAAVRCVGTSGGDCTATYADSFLAVGAASDGDTIRYGVGTFGPVDTAKVLKYRARLTATDGQGAKSRERRLAFRIVRG